MMFDCFLVQPVVWYDSPQFPPIRSQPHARSPLLSSRTQYHPPTPNAGPVMVCTPQLFPVWMKVLWKLHIVIPMSAFIIVTHYILCAGGIKPSGRFIYATWNCTLPCLCIKIILLAEGFPDMRHGLGPWRDVSFSSTNIYFLSTCYCTRHHARCWE